MQSRVVSPEYCSYPAAQVYVAVDGKRLPLEYETVPWDGASTALHSRPTQVGMVTDQVPSARHEAEVVEAGVSSYPVLQEKVATSRYLNTVLDGETVPLAMLMSSHGTPMHSGVDPAHVLSVLQSRLLSVASTSWYPVLHVYVAVLGYTCWFEVETTALFTVGGSLQVTPTHWPALEPPQPDL